MHVIYMSVPGHVPRGAATDRHGQRPQVAISTCKAAGSW